MKKFKLYIGVLFCVVTISTSCGAFLDEEPVSNLSTNLFWKTDSDIESARAAMYISFANAMSSNFFSWGEIRGENWDPFLHFGNAQEELINDIIPETNSACYWTDIYETVNRANLIIKYVPAMTGVDPAIATPTIGEAYAMRALAYFYIVRVWGDAPLFLEAVEAFDVNSCLKQRESKEVLLTHIESDLKTAATYLPDIGTSTALDRTYITLPAVYAIQMDLYAWEHRYDEVVKIWEEKIVNLPVSQYAFKDFKTTEVSDEAILQWRSIVWDQTTDLEVFFAVHYDKAADARENDTRAMFCADGERLIIGEKILADFDPNDIRFKGTVREYRNEDTGELNSIAYKLEKFWDLNNADIKDYASDNDLIMYRYSDLMLLYAEALNDQNRSQEAIALVNKTRERAGLAALALTLDKTQTADAILSERRFELLGEGKYWFDLVRTGNAQRIAGCSDARIPFPIHRDHLLQNSNLEQTKY